MHSLSLFHTFIHIYSQIRKSPILDNFRNVCTQQIQFHKHKPTIPLSYSLSVFLFEYCSCSCFRLVLSPFVSLFARFDFFIPKWCAFGGLAIGHIKIIENQDRNRKRHWNRESASCDTDTRPGQIIIYADYDASDVDDDDKYSYFSFFFSLQMICIRNYAEKKLGKSYWTKGHDALNYMCKEWISIDRNSPNK